MKKKKLLGMLMSLGLVGVIATGGTLAYLTSQSNAVNNTFTVGTGYIPADDGQSIKLDETDVTNPSNRTEEGNDYTDLYPGDVVIKDPTVYLTSGSVESYVFVKVTGVNELESITAKVNENGTQEQAFAVDNWGTSYWKKISELDGKFEPKGDTGNGYYVAKLGKTIDLSEMKEKGNYITLGTPLFTEVIMNGNLIEVPSNDEVKLKNIKISACAVQYTDGQTVNEAFNAAKFE